MTTSRRLALTVLVSIICQGVADAQQENLCGQDVFELAYANAPVISPNGNWVVYQVVKANEDTDRFEQSWVCQNVATGVIHSVLSRYSLTSSPAWRADSGAFAVGATRNDKHYLVIVAPKRSRIVNIMEVESAPKNPTWSESGERIAFNGFVPQPQQRLVEINENAADGNWAAPVIEIQRDIYRRDGEGYLPHGYHQVFVANVAELSVAKVTESEYDHRGPFCWESEDAILFTGQLYENWEHTPRKSYIYRLDVNSKALTQYVDIEGPVATPTRLGSDGQIAFLGYKDLGNSYQQQDVLLLDPQNHSITNLTRDFDRSVSSIRSSGDGKLYLQYDDHGVGKIGCLDLKTRSLADDVVIDVGGISIGRPYQGGTFSVSDDGALAYPKASVSRPAEIAINQRGAETMITSVADAFVESHAICSVKRFTVPSTYDEQPIDGWAVFPPGYQAGSGRKYPLILEIHGGPFANYGSRFAMEPQLYASAGYIVVYTNPRGSTSYGEKFAQLIDKDYPQQGDYEDLMSAVEHAIENYSADPERLYVTGGSGGGILTAWLVTRTNRFKAAVSQKPVINWETLSYTSDGYFYFTKYWFDGPPTAIADEYRRRSPLSYVDQVKTPTMLMTGEQDWRTPITESEQFYQGLKLHGVDTMLIRVPGSSHSIAARPSRIWMKLNYLTAWFTRYQ